MDAIRRRPLLFAALVLAVLLEFGVFTFAGPCVHEDGSHSTCYGAFIAIAVAGGVAALSALFGLFSRGGKVAVALEACACVAGVFAALAPGVLLPLCMMQTMRCWTVMRPFALVVGIALAACAAIAAIRTFRTLRASAGGRP